MPEAMIWAALGTAFPFLMTTLGAAAVFFFAKEPRAGGQRALIGFAAGVMTAASIWSLLLPAMECSAPLPAWLPASVGLLTGTIFLGLLDAALPKLRCRKAHARPGKETQPGSEATPEDPGRPGEAPSPVPEAQRRRDALLMTAITLHNIPEGMAVGVVYAGWMAGDAGVSRMAALALAIGIAIQNFPEGAIVSMPLLAEGRCWKKRIANEGRLCDCHHATLALARAEADARSLAYGMDASAWSGSDNFCYRSGLGGAGLDEAGAAAFRPCGFSFGCG